MKSAATQPPAADRLAQAAQAAFASPQLSDRRYDDLLFVTDYFRRFLTLGLCERFAGDLARRFDTWNHPDILPRALPVIIAALDAAERAALKRSLARAGKELRKARQANAN